jgi:hypothetical protein
MRLTALGAAGLLLALTTNTSGADEPKLPASTDTPITAYAKAEAFAKGSAIITLKVVDSEAATETRDVVVYESVTQEKDGKRIVVMVPVVKKVTVTVLKPKRWREVKVNTGDAGVSAHDTAGKPIPANKLPELLKKEVPVLVAPGRPIDPFHLLTAKEGTVVIVVPPNVLNPALTPPPGLPQPPVVQPVPPKP